MKNVANDASNERTKANNENLNPFEPIDVTKAINTQKMKCIKTAVAAMTPTYTKSSPIGITLSDAPLLS